ncbi:MAG TPA: glutamate 5-kinase [Lachnospiraceae bacterium]|nr:glutamate 5-kinase [Lachnospiraceae bacterium]
MTDYRDRMKDKKRIVVKIGSSSLQHPKTGDIDYIKLEKLVRELCDLRNQGKDVVLVTSGAIAVGKKAVNPYRNMVSEPQTPLAYKQACAAVGQAKLMMTYQKIFAEYNQIVAQILMTKNTIIDDMNRYNAHNTFFELLQMGIIPIVNENDTIATYEINVEADNDTLIGDNDTLSAIVAVLVEADLLIILSDIDGLYTDDPRKNENARFIDVVEELCEEYVSMGKASTGSNVGTGGMNTKMVAAQIATSAGADMVIANSEDVGILHRIINGKKEGTLFLAHKNDNFDLPRFVDQIHKHE